MFTQAQNLIFEKELIPQCNECKKKKNYKKNLKIYKVKIK